MKRALAALLFAGCSLSLGLNGETGRPCQGDACLTGWVCLRGTCVPAVGGECKGPRDCPSGVCVDGGCGLPPCIDGLKNFRETDIDCGGGSCGRCDAGHGCSASTDCESDVCGGDAGPTTCQAPSCGDGVQNNHESDVDCGGDAGCPRCADGRFCLEGPDCVTGSCAGVCQPGACIDGVKNGPETDVDCGGPCRDCVDGKGCANGSDCVSKVCSTTLSCSVPTCNDNQQNGPETAIDCGGGACQGCGDGLPCRGPTDCTHGVCQDLTCRPAHCGDGAQNGPETDKDCGGPCKRCGGGDHCDRDSDCKSNDCLVGYCLP